MVGNQMEYETHPKDAQPELCMFLGKFSFMSEKLFTNKFIRCFHQLVSQIWAVEEENKFLIGQN